MPLETIAILGAGISGVSSALAISQTLSPTPKITVFEVRPTPSTIGGAVNLTPNALRYLDRLGVLQILKSRGYGYPVQTIDIFSVESGQNLGEVDFRGKDGTGFDGYKALRVSRGDLLKALLEAVGKLENVEVLYGKKAIGFEEGAENVEVRFQDGSSTTADLALGCDGIHSATRMTLVEPDREPVYSGVATAYGFADTGRLGEEHVHFRDTSANSSRRGTLIASYCDADKTTLYVAAATETKELESREGWRIRGDQQEEIKTDLLERFKSRAIPCLELLVGATENWFLYPVYRLPPKGKWCSRRAMLLGDAAHAMPPQGESTGLALEDVVLFSRILSYHETKSLQDMFEKYEALRRKKIDEAYEEAMFRWETVKDKGWFKMKLVEFGTPWFLWWTKASRDEGLRLDIDAVDLGCRNG